VTHTPGPWLYARIDDTTEAIVTDEGDSICDVRGASAADLSLIANAPALLAALRALMSLDVKGHALADRLQFSDSGRALLDQCRAAIARATYTPEA